LTAFFPSDIVYQLKKRTYVPQFTFQINEIGFLRRKTKTVQPEEWIFGFNPVLEALKAGRNIKAVYVSSGRHGRVPEIRKTAELRGVPVEFPNATFFDTRFPKGHQGVAARVVQRGYVSLDHLISIPSRKREIPLFILLDSIEDPRNFGAILRTADAAGVHGVVIQSHRSVSLGPEVARTSAGAVEYVSVSMVTNIKYAIQEMKGKGIMVMGAESEAHAPIWDLDLTQPLAVVVGSEGKGIRRTVKEHCDFVVSIPMRGEINSLNVSVATGIFLFEIVRQRYGNLLGATRLQRFPRE
jgi:23S rRNA (guanosine2251-2'-O)-methyltransferase